MMKWGRKKSTSTPSPSPSSSSSSSRQSLISHAFPLTWLSRFKNVKGGLESGEVDVRGLGKGKKGSASPKRGVADDSLNGGRFYGRDDDSFWSLSFRKDRLKSEIGKCGSKPGWYPSDDELHSPPLDMVSQRRKARESRSLQRNYGCKVKTDSGEVEVKPRMRRALKHQKSGQESRRMWEEEQIIRGESDKENVNSTRSVPGWIIQETDKKSRKPTLCDSRRKHSVSFSHSIDLGTIEEDCIFEDLISAQSDTLSADELSQIKKNKKINEMMLRDENQKTARHLRKERQRRRMKQSRKVQVCSPRSPAKIECKVKACSPRSPAKIECKIKALEDMKRARNKMKKMTKEGVIKDKTNFDSFAVEKCSKDPEEDFRDSMVDMIREKGIRQPEELEKLLACYLTLNCDEYHDLIVKVFRESNFFNMDKPTGNSKWFTEESVQRQWQ